MDRFEGVLLKDRHGLEISRFGGCSCGRKENGWMYARRIAVSQWVGQQGYLYMRGLECYLAQKTPLPSHRAWQVHM